MTSPAAAVKSGIDPVAPLTSALATTSISTAKTTSVAAATITAAIVPAAQSSNATLPKVTDASAYPFGAPILDARRKLDAVQGMPGVDPEKVRALRFHYTSEQEIYVALIEDEVKKFTKPVLSEAAQKLLAAKAEFDKIKPAIDNAYKQLENKTDEERASIKQTLLADAKEWQKIYLEHYKAAAKTSVAQVNQERAALVQATSRMSVPLTQEHIDAIIDPAVKERATAALKTYQDNVTQFLEVIDNLGEVCKAIGLYIELVAMLISVLLGGVALLPAAIGWGIYRLVERLWGIHPQQQVFSAAAPDPNLQLTPISKKI